MKSTILILFATIFAHISAAQSIHINEQEATFSTGIQKALVTTIYKSSKNDLMDKWKDYLKKFKNERIKIYKNEMKADNVLMKEWGNNPVDIYTLFEENKKSNLVKMEVAFDLGGTYLTREKDSAKYALAESMIKTFSIRANKFPYEEEIRIAEDVLKNTERDQKYLENQNKDLYKNIESYKDKIKRAEDEINKNENNQKKMKDQINNQKNSINQIKSEMEMVK